MGWGPCFPLAWCFHTCSPAQLTQLQHARALGRQAGGWQGPLRWFGLKGLEQQGCLTRRQELDQRSLLPNQVVPPSFTWIRQGGAQKMRRLKSGVCVSRAQKDASPSSWLCCSGNAVPVPLLLFSQPPPPLSLPGYPSLKNQGDSSNDHQSPTWKMAGQVQVPR